MNPGRTHELVEHGSPEWWFARRGVPTASDFDRIITPSTGKVSASALPYACSLIADEFDPHYGFRLDEFTSKAMRDGLTNEPRARQLFQLETGLTVETGGFVRWGRFGCSPDGLVMDGDAVVGGLECKCPTPRVHVEYMYRNALPNDYKPQVHGCMVVTGYRQWWFVSYCKGFPPVIVRVTWDEYTEQLADAIARFGEVYDAAREVIVGRGLVAKPKRKVAEVNDVDDLP